MTYDSSKILLLIDSSTMAHACYNLSSAQHTKDVLAKMDERITLFYKNNSEPTEEELATFIRMKCRLVNPQGFEMMMKNNQGIVPKTLGELVSSMAKVYRKYPGAPSKERLELNMEESLVYFQSVHFLPMLKNFQCIFVGDGKPYWRKSVYENYKSKRDTAPDKKFFIKKYIKRLDPIILPGYEADDLAAAISQQAEGRVLLCTLDTDWLQLITKDNRVNWFRLFSLGLRFSNNWIDHALSVDWVEKKILKESEKTGKLMEEYRPFSSRTIVDYKVLTGDASDNIKRAALCDFDSRSIIDLINPPEQYNLAKREDFDVFWRAHVREPLESPETGKGFSNVSQQRSWPGENKRKIPNPVN